MSSTQAFCSTVATGSGFNNELTMPATTLENPGNSPLMNWIKDHLDYPHKDYCLVWPFNAGNHGYPTFVREGKKHYVSRFICQTKHGPPPSPEHHAAHSCNRGHLGCLNHHHLSWKTRSENLLESTDELKRRLHPDQVQEIRDLKGLEPRHLTASRFGVRECTVKDIQAGRTWKTGAPGKYFFTDDQVRRIRLAQGALSAIEVAAEYKVSRHIIYRIWARKAWDHVPDADCALSSGDRK